MIQSMDEYKPYQELAAAIVRVASADYVEALIIIERGGALTKAQKKKIFLKFIEYGQKRYVYQFGGIYFKQKENINRYRLSILKNKLDANSHKYKAEMEARIDEEFFRSALFAIFMPTTDPETYIKLLNKKADARELIASGYDSFLKHKAAKYDD